MSDTFTLTVSPVNDAPSFTAGTNQVVNEDADQQTVAWATGISAGPDDESSQTLAFTVTNNNNALFAVQPTIAPEGTLTYRPAADASGTATVTVILTDDGGTANGGIDTSAEQTFTITMNPVNDAPNMTSHNEAALVTVAIEENNLAVTNVTASDIDGPGLTFTIAGGDDADLFQVDSSGALWFRDRQDYEAPADRDGDNVYDVWCASRTARRSTSRRSTSSLPTWTTTRPSTAPSTSWADSALAVMATFSGGARRPAAMAGRASPCPGTARDRAPAATCCGHRASMPVTRKYGPSRLNLADCSEARRTVERIILPIATVEIRSTLIAENHLRYQLPGPPITVPPSLPSPLGRSWARIQEHCLSST